MLITATPGCGWNWIVICFYWQLSTSWDRCYFVLGIEQVRLSNNQRHVHSPLHDALLLEEVPMMSYCEAVLLDKPTGDTLGYVAPVRSAFSVIFSLQGAGRVGGRAGDGMVQYRVEYFCRLPLVWV